MLYPNKYASPNLHGDMYSDESWLWDDDPESYRDLCRLVTDLLC